MLLRVAQWGQAPLRPHVDAEDKEDALIQGPLGGAQTMAQWGQAPLRRGSIFHANLYITLLGTFPDNLTTWQKKK